MLFNKNILICNLVLEGTNDIANIINSNISFGGSKISYVKEDLFEYLKKIGIIPIFAYPVEYRHCKDTNNIELIYATVEYIEGNSKKLLSYRKIELPTKNSRQGINEFISDSIKSNLNLLYFFSNNDVNINFEIAENEPQIINSIEKGIELIKALNGRGIKVFPSFIDCANNLRSACKYVDGFGYCNIKGNRYILVTIEDFVREVAILPYNYSIEGIKEYIDITHGLYLEKVEELLLDLEKMEEIYGK